MQIFEDMLEIAKEIKAQRHKEMLLKFIYLINYNNNIIVNSLQDNNVVCFIGYVSRQ